MSMDYENAEGERAMSDLPDPPWLRKISNRLSSREPGTYGREACDIQDGLRKDATALLAYLQKVRKLAISLYCELMRKQDRCRYQCNGVKTKENCGIFGYPSVLACQKPPKVKKE